MPHKWLTGHGFLDFPPMRLALFEPDIPPNAGTLLRLGACLNVPVDIIEPCGFPFSARTFRRAALDYLAHAEFRSHRSWNDFLAARAPGASAGRLVLLTTKATRAHTDFAFARDDTLLLGRETGGVPDYVHERADARLRIPMAPGLRSLNVALAAAIVLGEALRQTGLFPAALARVQDGAHLDAQGILEAQ
jgi:tRNA (cytidine/uridine-2'-O-)-methyltransferase